MRDETEQENNRRVTDTELGRLCNSLGIIADWLRAKMKKHVDPDPGKQLLQSEKDVNEMIEVYLGTLFHYIFQLSTGPSQPHNVSVLNRDESVTKMSELQSYFGITNKDLDDSAVSKHLRYLRAKLRSLIIGEQADEALLARNEFWAGCHLWLERRLATGSRLLFLEGNQWALNHASWTVSRVVYDWPNTFTKSTLQQFRASDEACGLTRPRRPSEICTCVCSFKDLQEKKKFESVSGLGEGDYLYLWSGEDGASLSDFTGPGLVWFKDPGHLSDDKNLQLGPTSALGRPEEIQKLWEILRQEWETGQLFRKLKLDPTLKMRYVYHKHLETIYQGLEGENSSGGLPGHHWLKRCDNLLTQILGRGKPRPEAAALDNCFWAIQSIMFYDWKYWYMFPFTYEDHPSGGMAISCLTPLTPAQLEEISLITRKLLEVFADTEQWARSRIQRRRRSNLVKAARRVHEKWVERGRQRKGINDHAELFRELLGVGLQPESAEPTERQAMYRHRTWNEHQNDNINYVVVNYWSALLPDRVFAEWLSLKNFGRDINATWQSVWSIYKEITKQAKENYQYYTFNEFLFEKAPRKAILEWRGHDWQIIQRGQNNPVEWVSEPPSITPEVIVVLFEGIQIKPGEVINIGRQISALRGRVKKIRKYLNEYVESYRNRFLKFKRDYNPDTLGLYENDSQCLGNVLEKLGQEVSDKSYKAEAPATQSAGSGDFDADTSDYEEVVAYQDGRIDYTNPEKLAAEYLVRLAIYLNVQMDTSSEGGDDTTSLNLSHCAFLSWALRGYYNPEIFGLVKEDQVKQIEERTHAQWYFYSIPIHVPLAQYEETSRTSILSLGTNEPLTRDELRLWREIGKEIVFPAMMIDLRKEVQARELKRLQAGMAVSLYHQLGQVLASLRSRTDQLIREGDELHDKLKHLADDPADEERLSAWEMESLYVDRRLRRAQKFREFAYAQLLGTVPEGQPPASAYDVAGQALEIAKEYLIGGNTDTYQVSIEFDSALSNVNVHPDAYGFILQEIIANAFKATSKDYNRIEVRLKPVDSEPFIEVRNQISEKAYEKFRHDPPKIYEEPGPEKQSGRGIFGLHCLFKARGIEGIPKWEVLLEDNRYWWSLSVPVIDFYIPPKK